MQRLAGVTEESRLENAVIILGGDTVVGRALELLLRGSDRNARFLSEVSELEEPGLIERTGLLLLAPGLDAERREAALGLLRQRSASRSVPVLELVSNARTEKLADDHFVASWPCQMEDLQKRIKSLMDAGNSSEQVRYKGGS